MTLFVLVFLHISLFRVCMHLWVALSQYVVAVWSVSKLSTCHCATTPPHWPVFLLAPLLCFLSASARAQRARGEDVSAWVDSLSCVTYSWCASEKCTIVSFKCRETLTSSCIRPVPLPPVWLLFPTAIESHVPPTHHRGSSVLYNWRWISNPVLRWLE